MFNCESPNESLCKEQAKICTNNGGKAKCTVCSGDLCNKGGTAPGGATHSNVVIASCTLVACAGLLERLLGF